MSGQIGDPYLKVISNSFGCDDATARVVALRGSHHHFNAHDVIIRAGDRDQGAWLMLGGEAQTLAYGLNGQYILVHLLNTGDLFGEAVGLSLATSAAEMSAVGLVDLGHFSTAHFISLMEAHHCIALSVTRMLITRLSQTTRRLVESVTLTAHGRTYAELLRTAQAGTAMTIRPMPIHSAFALRVQTSRETVSRALSVLEKRGITKRDGDGLIIVAPHRLEELIY